MAALPQERDDPGMQIHPPAAAKPDSESKRVGAACYRQLTGCDSTDAVIDDDVAFDRHVLASILAVGAAEGGPVSERAGLAGDDLAALIEQRFPTAKALSAAWTSRGRPSDCDEVVMVRDLLLANRSSVGDIGHVLAAMVARRAIEPNHLWEDLGLRDRAELSRLLSRHFAPLYARNTKNMRWKRFFYRALCEDDGLVMCSTPVCANCGDFDLCFGDESGESRLANQRRVLASKGASLSEPGEIVPPAALP